MNEYTGWYRDPYISTKNSIYTSMKIFNRGADRIYRTPWLRYWFLVHLRNLFDLRSVLSFHILYIFFWLSLDYLSNHLRINIDVSRTHDEFLRFPLVNFQHDHAEEWVIRYLILPDVSSLLGQSLLLSLVFLLYEQFLSAFFPNWTIFCYFLKLIFTYLLL